MAASTLTLLQVLNHPLSWGEQHLAREQMPGKDAAMSQGHVWLGLGASFGAQDELWGLECSWFLGAGTAMLPHRVDASEARQSQMCRVHL